MMFALSKSAKISILLTVGINIIMNTSDTGSDIGMFAVLMNRGFLSLAFVLLGLDFLPGVIVTIHHINSTAWSIITLKQKILSVLLLAVQPFSVIITNCFWIMNIDNNHCHLMARLSTVLHESMESPLQLLMIFYLWSKGYIPLPWEQTSVFTDHNGNDTNFGNFAAIFSLCFSLLGVLKGAVDIYEAHEEKYAFLVFTFSNITFRVLSFAFFIQYYDEWIYILPLVMIILLINAWFFLRRANRHGSSIGLLSSILCSVVVPVFTSDQPHHYQLKLHSLGVEERKNEEEKRQELSHNLKKCSSFLAVATSPFILLADVMVVVKATDESFHNDTVWTCLLYTSDAADE